MTLVTWTRRGLAAAATGALMTLGLPGGVRRPDPARRADRGADRGTEGARSGRRSPR